MLLELKELHGNELLEALKETPEAAAEEVPARIAFAAAALGVLLIALFFRVSALEFFLLVLAALLVIFAELINTAIETLVDLITDDYHELAKRAKDIAAGGVLLCAIGAAVVGFIIFLPRLLALT